MHMPSVEIGEVSPRDGLQSEQPRLTTAEKVELIGLAMAAGARRIEASSFVNPKRVPQMADAEDVMRLLPKSVGMSYIGLALNERGAERAVEANCDEVNFVFVATDFEHALSDPQVLTRKLIVDVPVPGSRPVSMSDNPVKLGNGSDNGFMALPRLGEHSEEVFTTRLGMERDRLDSLRERGVIE